MNSSAKQMSCPEPLHRLCMRTPGGNQDQAKEKAKSVHSELAPASGAAPIIQASVETARETGAGELSGGKREGSSFALTRAVVLGKL